MKIYKIAPKDRKVVKPPYIYEGDGITEYMVRLPINRHWRRVFVHNSRSYSHFGKGRRLLRSPEDADFDLPEFFYYVVDRGNGANFIPVEFA